MRPAAIPPVTMLITARTIMVSRSVKPPSSPLTRTADISLVIDGAPVSDGNACAGRRIVVKEHRSSERRHVDRVIARLLSCGRTDFQDDLSLELGCGKGVAVDPQSVPIDSYGGLGARGGRKRKAHCG